MAISKSSYPNIVAVTPNYYPSASGFYTGIPWFGILYNDNYNWYIQINGLTSGTHSVSVNIYYY